MEQPLNARSITSEPGPSTLWLAVGFLLAGLGTAVLGPILPVVSAHWQLTDAQGGTLFLAKFCGACFGGLSVPRRLRYGILSGTICACAGFGSFAFAVGQFTGAIALLVGGFGLGQIIASTNILAGRRYQNHTGSALASLNFFFAFGAVITGVLAGALVPHFGLRTPLLSFAALLIACGVGGWLSSRFNADAAIHDETPVASALTRRTLLVFALLLFLYGGLETCLTSWLTTFTLRFSDATLLHGQSGVVLFWTALTAGRLLASLALRYIRDTLVQAAGVAASILLIGSLALSHHAFTLSAECILLGLALAPWFPATFAILIRQRPSARTAGFILAVSGLGAALFPWLMGVVSTASGSLRVAMLVPMFVALAMLILARLQPTLPPSGNA